MKTKFNLLITALITAGTCVLTSCAKDGEAGPKGSTGATGDPGANGTNGTNGTNGNANVKSFNYTLALADWTILATNSIQAKVGCAGITQAIIDSGMVIIYWDAHNSTSPYYQNFVPLPVLYFNTIKSRILTCSWQLTPAGVGQITFKMQDLDGLALSIPTNILFKAVVASPFMRLAHPNLNWNNYNEVKAALNLQD